VTTTDYGPQPETNPRGGRGPQWLRDLLATVAMAWREPANRRNAYIVAAIVVGTLFNHLLARSLGW
jgi:hypothetical protein